MYFSTPCSNGFKIENFFEEISKALVPVVKANYQLVVFGPGETKKKIGRAHV